MTPERIEELSRKRQKRRNGQLRRWSQQAARTPKEVDDYRALITQPFEDAELVEMLATWERRCQTKDAAGER